MRMDIIRETGWEGVEWIHLAQDRGKWSAVVNMGTIKGQEFLV